MTRGGASAVMAAAMALAAALCLLVLSLELRADGADLGEALGILLLPLVGAVTGAAVGPWLRLPLGPALVLGALLGALCACLGGALYLAISLAVQGGQGGLSWDLGAMLVLGLLGWPILAASVSKWIWLPPPVLGAPAGPVISWLGGARPASGLGKTVADFAKGEDWRVGR